MRPGQNDAAAEAIRDVLDTSCPPVYCASEAAVSAAADAYPGNDAALLAASLIAAHHPSLGVERSVCLADAVAEIKRTALDWPPDARSVLMACADWLKLGRWTASARAATTHETVATTFHRAICALCGESVDGDGQEYRATPASAVAMALELGFERHPEQGLICSDCAMPDAEDEEW